MAGMVEISQPVFTEVAEPHSRRASSDGFGHHDLATVGRGHDPRRLVERRSVPTASAALRLAEVDSHANREAAGHCPRRRRDRLLRRGGSRHGVGRARERSGERVTGGPDDIATGALDRPTHEVVVHGEIGTHRRCV